MAKGTKLSTTGDTTFVKPQTNTAGDTAEMSTMSPQPVTPPERPRTETPLKPKDDTITVNRAAFEKMIVALSMGHAENYISQAIVVQVNALFGLKTRDEGVKKLAELRQSHRDRVEKGQ